MTTLVTLVLILCTGSDCRSVRVPGQMQPMACMLAGQQIAAEMGERLAGWRCEVGERA